MDVQLGGEVFRPDLCGYRRERMPRRPQGRPVLLTPDWICEILSPSNASTDRVEKLDTYFKSGVPHSWLIDPLAGTLEVFRRTDLAFALVKAAHRGQVVRAEPFDAVEISVDELLGVDPVGNAG
jgi:Uma2 family endonuclease